MSHFDIGHSSGKGVSGTFTGSSSAMTKITLGFKPKFLCVVQGIAGSAVVTSTIYNENISTTKQIYAGASTSLALEELGISNNNRIYSIDNDGFTMCKISSGHESNFYFAIP